ncbi:MAG TPA: sigma-70 family RNA polymerase sigma factor [Pirellulales bacterium]|jgi:RNA polymerase sigma-70 factor (ECF subfamily)|nr:sigma-70 family RNA polymerase sigma factor [Pirellulales bacterium]
MADSQAANPPSSAPSPAQFAILLSRHHTSLMGYIFSLLPNWSDAEDILQQTSVVMWNKFGEFQPGTDFLRWGCQIAKFNVFNHLRKQRRDRHIFSEELLDVLAREGIADVDYLHAERHALQQCLEKLDAASRSLLQQFYRSGAAVKELAAGLNRTPNSIYKTLCRTREALLRCVRKSLALEST